MTIGNMIQAIYNKEITDTLQNVNVLDNNVTIANDFATIRCWNGNQYTDNNAYLNINGERIATLNGQYSSYVGYAKKGDVVSYTSNKPYQYFSMVGFDI